MRHNIYIYILIMFGVTYAIRVLPLTLIQRQIKSRWIRSFLYYVPYVTLTVMTFPAILEGVTVACRSGNLFKVALSCCAVVFLSELFLLPPV